MRSVGRRSAAPAGTAPAALAVTRTLAQQLGQLGALLAGEDGQRGVQPADLALQVVALLVCIAPWIASPISDAAAATGLAVLLVSFFLDLRWLRARA